MNYGFIIDNRKCIGCHACSTACKSENDVPLGVNRTWVKYVETGEYPDVRRNFQVTRCNHCANPPCVRICPTTAMFQRADGIVEFDSAVCIGCKACMQACPYDAIYIDPASHTAAKCHYCAHRTDLGLEPACVVVCPEHAILAGDLDDPASEISRTLAAEQVTVRKPEQGTLPKLFYIEGNEFALRPTAAPQPPQTFLWADVIPLQSSLPLGQPKSAASPANTTTNPAGASLPLLPPRSHTPATPEPGPIRMGQGRMAEQMVQVSYNAQHEIPWDWPVPAYLVTKGIASGLFLILAGVFGLGLLDLATPAHVNVALVSGLFILLFTALTAGLLVLDLERPERFLYILLRPQWKSWLTRGAFILLGFSAVAAVWWLAELAHAWQWLTLERLLPLLRTLTWLAGVPLAVGTAVYTAYLFGQAEGRDLWQSSLLPLHLLIQAWLAGSAFLLAAAAVWTLPMPLYTVAYWSLIISLGLSLFALFGGELGMSHASEGASRAARLIRRGPYARLFWAGAVVAGHLLPLALLAPAIPLLAALAGLLALGGLFIYEYVYVLAPQRVPNS